MTAGFTFAYMLNGGTPVIKDFYMKDTETLTRGDMVNIEVGEVDLAATNDTDLAGAVLGTVNPDDERDTSHNRTPGKWAGTDSTTRVRVIISPDAVYSITDANARNAGATLDIAGATGAMTLAASSSIDVVVVETKLQAADLTYVKIADSEHYLRAD